MPIYWTKKGGISLRRTQQTKHNSTATSPSASSRPHFNLPPFLSSVQYERELLARSRDHSDLYPTREKVSLSLFSRGPGRIYIYCIRHSPGPAFTMLFNGKSKTFFFSTDFFLNFENIFFSLLHSPPHSVISIFFVLFSKQCCWIRTAHRFFPELRVSISSTDFCSPAPPLNFSSVQNHCLPLLLLAF